MYLLQALYFFSFYSIVVIIIIVDNVTMIYGEHFAVLCIMLCLFFQICSVGHFGQKRSLNTITIFILG